MTCAGKILKIAIDFTVLWHRFEVVLIVDMKSIIGVKKSD